MMIPTADASGEYACPFINAAANCGSLSSEAYKHRYAPAGWWASSTHDFIMQLTPGTTVSYGYLPYQALNYWAHDGYTGMEILKLN
jgi:hypothetical protein